MLYDLLRPEIVSLDGIDPLCEVVDIIKAEVLDEGLGRYGQKAASMRPFADRALADTQERLIFRVQTFIRDEVGAYRATAADVKALARAADPPAGEGGGGGGRGGGGGSFRFPPVERTLWALSKLYRAVDAAIFSGLAQEAMAAATGAVLAAGRLVAAACGQGVRGQLDGHLAVVAQLLYLREQIAPFDADFVSTQKELEFSHMRDYLRRVLSGDSALFSLSAEGMLSALASQGAPRVVQHSVDSRKELEQAREGCEQPPDS